MNYKSGFSSSIEDLLCKLRREKVPIPANKSIKIGSIKTDLWKNHNHSMKINYGRQHSITITSEINCKIRRTELLNLLVNNLKNKGYNAFITTI